MKIKIPGSKSITQRALICASLGNGKTVLNNPLFCEDTELLINALKKLGIKINHEEKKIIVYGNSGKFESNGKQQIFMGNNGTGLRFLITLSCFYPDEVIITGNSRMKNRPVDELVETLIDAGFNIEYAEKKGFPPVVVKGFLKDNYIKSNLSITSTKSSQFISSLLLSGVLFKNGLILHTNKNIPSEPYINITIDVMKDFGINVTKDREKGIFKVPFSTYTAKFYNIEGDFSSASYFLVAPFFLRKKITIENIDYQSSLQPDKAIIDILKKMGAYLEIDKNSVTVFPSDLHGIEIDMNKCPDIVPTVAVLSSIINGTTVIKNIAHLKYKESNRIYAVYKNLKKLKVDIETGEDYIKINGNRNIQLKDTVLIETFDDHRIAMSFSLFRLLGINIQFDNEICVKKSFPDFWEIFKNFLLCN